MDTLREILTDVLPGVDFDTEEHLIDSGILTSLDIVMLVGELNDAFDISITVDELTPENFNSMAALYQLITRLQNE